MTHHSSREMVHVTIFFISLFLLISIEKSFLSCVFSSDIVVEALANPVISSQSRRNGKKRKLLIIGLGRVGLEVADLAIKNEFVQVFGTVKDFKRDHNDCSSNSAKIVRIPFDPIIVRKHLFGYKDQISDELPIESASHVLFSIPLSREADPLVEAVLKELKSWWSVEDDGIRGTRENKHESQYQSKVLGILSTTGVYGNHDGKVVNENSPLLCEESSNAELYRQFEDDWISLSVTNFATENSDANGNHCDTHRSKRLRIFRCAGIYDSSRSALHTVYRSLKSNTEINFSQKSLASSPKIENKTNRIHSTDLARGVLSGMCKEIDNEDDKVDKLVRIYNLADNLPESRSVVLNYAQNLLASIGIDQDYLGNANETTDVSVKSTKSVSSDKKLPSRSSRTRQRRREKESKLVCNQRMMKELFPDDDLLFPTYREGLHAIINDPTTPWQRRQ